MSGFIPVPCLLLDYSKKNILLVPKEFTLLAKYRGYATKSS